MLHEPYILTIQSYMVRSLLLPRYSLQGTSSQIWTYCSESNLNNYKLLYHTYTSIL